MSLVDWYKQYVQFQTTLAYLKEPTPEYQCRPIDILGGLDRISQKANSGRYRSQYDLELETRDLVNHACDGHFGINPFLIGAFTYNRTFSLVSVSLDGVQSPNIYITSKVLVAIRYGGWS